MSGLDEIKRLLLEATGQDPQPDPGAANIEEQQRKWTPQANALMDAVIDAEREYGRGSTEAGMARAQLDNHLASRGYTEMGRARRDHEGMPPAPSSY